MNNKILTAQPIQPLTLEGTAYQRGLGHGETFRHGFQTVLHIRYPDTDLEAFAVERVYKAGRIAAEQGRAVGIPEGPSRERAAVPLEVGPLVPERFRIEDRGGRARVIDLLAHQSRR